MHWRCSACKFENLGRFMVCQKCGDPTDSRESYEMPGDTAAAESVTDSELLRAASASENWRCMCCGSHQRSLHNTCAQCGAAVASAVPDPPSTNAKVGPALWGFGPRRSSQHADPNTRGRLVLIAISAFCGLTFVAVLVGATLGGAPKVPPVDLSTTTAPEPLPPPIVETQVVAKVSAASWSRTVSFETIK